MAEPRFEILDALAAIDLRVHDLDGAREIVGMLHFHVVEGQRLFDGVAEHVVHRGAHALETAVGAGDGEQVDGQVEEAVELGLGARAAGEIAANGVQRQRHENEREAAAADDDRLRDPGAAVARSRSRSLSSSISATFISCASVRMRDCRIDAGPARSSAPSRCWTASMPPAAAQFDELGAVLHARAHGVRERLHARELRGIRAHGVAQLLHQSVDAAHGARVFGGKRFLAGEHVGALCGFGFERRRDQRVDVRHHQLRMRDELSVLAEPHDAQIADDADGAEKGEGDGEADAHLAFGGRVPAFGAARGRLVAPLLQFVEQHADEHAHQQQEQPVREVERNRRTRCVQYGGNTQNLADTPASAVANRPGRRPPM